MAEFQATVNKVLEDPSASKWLKQGLASALRRDPVDAKADAETMQWLLEWQWDEIQKEGGAK